MRKGNEQAITLIALVITIIILLILAAVSVAMLISENGILGKAETATEKHQLAKYKEELEMAITTVNADRLTNTKKEVFAQSIKEEIEQKYQNNGEKWVKRVLMQNSAKMPVENAEECTNLIVQTIDRYQINIEINNEKNEAKVLEDYTIVEEEKIEIHLNKENIILATVTPNTKKYQLLPTITATNSSYAIEWTSSNEDVVTVDSNGMITAQKVGNAEITAEVKELDLKATCNVEVKDKICEITEGLVCSRES